jgi:RNA polymerase sigma factor (sigma-70 family)
VQLERILAASAEADGPLSVEEVFHRHSKDVVRWASRLGGPSIDLEDTVQEVFLTVHQHLPNWRKGTGRLTTWLFRITENAVRHRRRRDASRKWLGGSGEEIAGHLPSQKPTPHEELERQQSLERFYRVLEGMNEKYRSVLVLFELEAMSGEEIALLMEAKPATVWVWLHRARADFLKRMQTLMQKEGAW